MGGGGGAALADDDFATAKTSVWWDIENCQVPRACDPHMIAQNISSALAAVGYRGAVSIIAFGDTGQIRQDVQKALSSTGITLNHVPAGVKDASDKKILVDMLLWAVDNPPPANYLLISGDRDFSYALHQLSFRRYNILLANPPNVSQALVAAAKCVWSWKDLVDGGQPLNEAPYSSSTSSRTLGEEAASGSAADSGQTTAHSSGPPAHSSSQKTYTNGKADNRNKGRLRRYPNPNHANSCATPNSEFKQPLPASNGPINNSIPQYNNIRSPEQVPVQTISSTKAQENTQFNHTSYFPQPSPQKPPSEASCSYHDEILSKEASHEFIRGSQPNSSSGHATTRPDFPIEDGKAYCNNHRSHWTQPLRPSDLLNQPSIRPGNLSSSTSQNSNFYPPPNGPSGPQFTYPQGWTSGPPPFPPVPPGNLPDIGRVNISDYPNGGNHNNSSFKKTYNSNVCSAPEHNGSNGPHNSQTFYNQHMQRPSAPAIYSNMPMDGLWNNPASPVPSFEVQTILHSLQILRADKMVPTEENIVDCIHYGEMNVQSFNIKAALDYAVQYQFVVMHKIGNNLPLYVAKNEAIWKCVNPVDSCAKHPKASLDAVYKFLSSGAGRNSLMTSQCRYQAAMILRNSCLKHHTLGEVLQILHVVIEGKKWITPHPSGWQPLSFYLQGTDKNVSAGPSKKV